VLLYFYGFILSTFLFHSLLTNHKEITMPRICDMIPSNYLKQADFDQNGTIVSVKGLEQKNVAQDDQEPDLKWCIYFNEFDKPMVLNTTNINAMAEACDSDNSDDWMGQEVVVYVDANINFGGKRVGGLRVRRYTQTPAPVAAPARAASSAVPVSTGLPAAAGFPIAPTQLPAPSTSVATAPSGARSPAKARR
jgi:hypothetical protein